MLAVRSRGHQHLCFLRGPVLSGAVQGPLGGTFHHSWQWELCFLGHSTWGGTPVLKELGAVVSLPS